MSGRFPFRSMKFYPHMIVEEAEIWDKFMSVNPKMFETVDYDFRVGNGEDFPSPDAKEFTSMAKALSQKRIDALCWVGEKPTIVEVKKRVSLATLGQVLGYKILFKRDFKNIAEPAMLVITEMISFDDAEVMEKNGVEVIVL